MESDSLFNDHSSVKNKACIIERMEMGYKNSGQNQQVERLPGNQGFLATPHQMSVTSASSDQGMSTVSKSLGAPV